MSTRKTRASETEQLASAFWSSLWPHCHTKGMATPGCDLRATPGVAWEVKATRGLDIMGSLRQAGDNAGPKETPIVMYRPGGYGPTSVGKWPCFLYAEDLLGILDQAGYGESVAKENAFWEAHYAQDGRDA